MNSFIFWPLVFSILQLNVPLMIFLQYYLNGNYSILGFNRNLDIAKMPSVLCLLTFGPVDCECPALVVGDVEGEGVAALAAAEVRQVARVHPVVGVKVGVCNMKGVK